MDMSKLDKMPGMAAGFPFAMVLLGLVGAVAGSVMTGINEHFFVATGSLLHATGATLIMWGSILQGVLWICSRIRNGSASS